MYGAQLTPYLALSVAVQKQNKKQTTQSKSKDQKQINNTATNIFIYPLASNLASTHTLHVALHSLDESRMT